MVTKEEIDLLYAFCLYLFSFIISLFQGTSAYIYTHTQKSRHKNAQLCAQPNDNEIDTPKRDKIKVECLSRFHLISGTKLVKRNHIDKYFHKKTHRSAFFPNCPINSMERMSPMALMIPSPYCSSPVAE